MANRCSNASWLHPSCFFCAGTTDTIIDRTFDLVACSRHQSILDLMALLMLSIYSQSYILCVSLATAHPSLLINDAPLLRPHRSIIIDRMIDLLLSVVGQMRPPWSSWLFGSFVWTRCTLMVLPPAFWVLCWNPNQHGPTNTQKVGLLVLNVLSLSFHPTHTLQTWGSTPFYCPASKTYVSVGSEWAPQSWRSCGKPPH